MLNGETIPFTLLPSIPQAIIPELEAAVAKEMKSTKRKTRQIATIIHIMLKTGIRVGNRKKGNVEEQSTAVGLCTLKNRDITINETTVTFNFTGKSGIPYEKDVNLDRVAVKNLKEWVLTDDNHKSHKVFSVSVG